jgi:uncharacterized protein
MSWAGMNHATGNAVDDADHIRQSVRDILTTPLGSRLMRRDYGSEIFALIDQPQNGATHLRLMSAVVIALLRWEPRIQINSIDLGTAEVGGGLTITIDYTRRDTNHRNGQLTVTTGTAL